MSNLKYTIAHLCAYATVLPFAISDSPYPKWPMAELSGEALFVISTSYIFPRTRKPQAARLRPPVYLETEFGTPDMRSRIRYVRKQLEAAVAGT